MRHFFFLFFLAISVSDSLALPRVSPLFGNHMVLQRNKPIRIWGKANPGEKVILRFNSLTRSSKAGRDSTWLIELPAQAAGGPHQIQVGEQMLEDVFFGDVWLASGQSNMEWKLKKPILNGPAEIAAANHPQIRFTDLPNTYAESPQTEIPADGWWVCSPETAPEISAVAYFFAKEIRSQVDVPIGLILCEWGGTPVEAWMPAESVAALPPLPENGPGTSSKPIPQNNPSALFNGMISPLKNLSFSGVIWYQGEANVGKSARYEKAFPAMITDWRKHFGQGDFPFYFVQLAGFLKPDEEPPLSSPWADLRDAQQKALALPNTGMATAVDLGEAKDIHPKNKQDVGKRLAWLALNQIYQKNIPCQNAVISGVQKEGNRFRVSLNHLYEGLQIRNKYGYIHGFSVAGPDHRFRWARAWKEGNQLLVECPELPDPTYIRYGWANNPDDLNLYNSAGLPLLPYRNE